VSSTGVNEDLILEIGVGSRSKSWLYEYGCRVQLLIGGDWDDKSIVIPTPIILLSRHIYPTGHRNHYDSLSRLERSTSVVVRMSGKRRVRLYTCSSTE
jgi:hypothetical protein